MTYLKTFIIGMVERGEFETEVSELNGEKLYNEACSLSSMGSLPEGNSSYTVSVVFKHNNKTLYCEIVESDYEEDSEPNHYYIKIGNATIQEW